MTFDQLGLSTPILNAINDMGFITPSDVQAQAIPTLLTDDTDLVALAQTGTGKTAAFGFPLLEKISLSRKQTQGLVIAPTRELCLQITNELKLYSKYMTGCRVVAVYGGANIMEQSREINKGAHIIVATPGRMQDMMRRGMVDISEIDYCVLDEADEMLNMGFYEDITTILADTPESKQTWLFSATMPKEVARIAKKFMNDPQEITVGHKNESTKNVRHEYYQVSSRDRYAALKRLADANPSIFSVIFCRTKRDTQKVAEKLIEDGYSAAAIHGDLSQNQRDLVMRSFRSRQIQMLVATDVAARGIDVNNITHVINYQLPDEVETYTHRSGRTGRAGKSGVSIVIVNKGEIRKIRQIEKIIGRKFEQKTVPNGMEICQVQLFHLANKIKNTEVNTEIESYLPGIEEQLEGISKEELIKKVFSVEFTRFFNYYKSSKDLNVNAKAEDKEESGDSTRFFINVGTRDDFDWMSLKDLLKEVTGLTKEGIYRVECKESFSFFNTDTEHKELIFNVFNEFEIEGRKVNVEETTKRAGKRGDRSNGKRTNRSQGGGSFKRSSGRNDRSRSDRGRDNNDRKRNDRSRSDSGERSNRRSSSSSNNSPFSGKRRRKH